MNANQGKLCSYFGQVDKHTQKPNGIGIAIDQEDQDIMEGFFKHGRIDRPCIKCHYTGLVTASFRAKGGSEYTLTFQNEKF